MSKQRQHVIQDGLITKNDPKSVISEKFKGIRTNIMFSTEKDDIKSIVFTSERPSVGKSFVSSNVAVTYAQAGYKTLLIDGDMRKPTQHYVFNTSNSNGLSSLIINQAEFDEAIKHTDVEILDLLTSGPIPLNPSELLGSKQFQTVLNRLYKIYDLIIIDTPPVNTVTDAQLLAEHSGYVVLVIDVKENNRNDIKKAQELLEHTGTKILGVVLNKTTEDNSSSYYSYYGESGK
ncbi:polysaccharide biosynthesis tyrosine autokinase [Staphylococcus sp. IVB6181]|uniref:polysaccharide biosynthesis tyrosine autokinase n=1 Tax=Staphylococcus sp. IVB6181 TaxID=2929481 RepID=UPI0021CEE2D4|nr:polysaccharide biosynthesis tyrosine autokinase [Staphylococcus sp. IVB6181]UXV34166.1 polysaccharide biosynthesis tyrosine autokinase [Staphylococcus sp. IVB6181]